MKKLTIRKTMVLAVLATVAWTLLSVKWMLAPAAWVAPALLIVLMHRLSPWKSLLAGLGVLYVSGLIAGYAVMPFPGVVFAIIAALGAVKQALPFFVYRLLGSRVRGWMGALLFACLYVVYDYLNSFDGGGSWGSIAYSQVGSEALMQLASVTGIWGVTFLLAWAAGLVASWANEGFQLERTKAGVGAFAITLALVVVGGTLRTNPLWQGERATVRVAGIASQNLELLQVTYEAVFGHRLAVDLNTLTQTSPELQELNKGLVKFIEHPDDPMFAGTHRQMEAFQDKILGMAAREAQAGAKIVSLSEALLFTTKATEGQLIEKARRVAASEQFYLLLTMATIVPGEVTMGAKYLENKALLIGPDGEVKATFFKNKPVPLVEPSVQGDGSIPVVHTPFGRIAISICYDADFPTHMRQAGQQNADILLLPSGDWREISPYHGWMASVRGIENGFSMLRPVSNATSMATDFQGKLIGAAHFSPGDETVLVAQLPIGGQPTLYRRLGDWLVWICGVGAVGLIGVSVWRPRRE